MLLGTTVIFVHETIRIIKLCHVTWIVKSICGRKRFLSHVFTRMPMIMWECKYISEDLQLCHTLTSWTKANFKKTSHAPVCTWFKNESYGVIGEAANPQPHPFLLPMLKPQKNDCARVWYKNLSIKDKFYSPKRAAVLI